MRGQPKLIRRKDSPYWFIYVPKQGNRRAQRISTGEAYSEQAELIFGQFLLEYKKPRLKHRDKIEINDMLERYAEHHKESKVVGYHLRTLKPFFAGMALSQFTRQTARDYAAHRTAQFATVGKRKSKRKVSPSSAARELTTLASALSFARQEGFITELPFIEKPKANNVRERWLTEAEVGAILNAAKQPYIRLYIELAINTGARPSSILELKWFQVDLASRLIHFNPPGREQTGKHRPTVYINDSLLHSLTEARKMTKGTYVVSSGRGNTLGKLTSIKRGFAAPCADAGLSGITPYTLRHTAITWMARAGVDLWQIAKAAGHKDTRTTMRYMKWSPEFGREAMDALSTGAQLAHKASENAKKQKKPQRKMAK